MRYSKKGEISRDKSNSDKSSENKNNSHNNKNKRTIKTMLKATLFLAILVNALPTLAQQACLSDSIMSTAPSDQYKVKDDGTVTDNKYQLMWKQCLEGLNGKQCETGTLEKMHWANALLWISSHNNDGFAGYDDWRLPNIRELSTLTEMQCREPAINVDVFANAPATHVWSSSPYHFYTHYSWYVDFNDGVTTYDDRLSEKALWLVRDLK